MSTILITGANRGLGLEFVEQYAADGWDVIACCRTPATADELQAVAANVLCAGTAGAGNGIECNRIPLGSPAN